MRNKEKALRVQTENLKPDPRADGSLAQAQSSDLPERHNLQIPRRDWCAALGFAALVVLLGQRLMVEGVSGVYHDDGIYISTAKAIAQGDGYRLINLPDSPAQTKYPILYPALLSLIWRLQPSFPENLVWMQWTTLFCGAARWQLTGGNRFSCSQRCFLRPSLRCRPS
jgi:hypothetical protein